MVLICFSDLWGELGPKINNCEATPPPLKKNKWGGIYYCGPNINPISSYLIMYHHGRAKDAFLNNSAQCSKPLPNMAVFTADPNLPRFGWCPNHLSWIFLQAAAAGAKCIVSSSGGNVTSRGLEQNACYCSTDAQKPSENHLNNHLKNHLILAILNLTTKMDRTKETSSWWQAVAEQPQGSFSKTS